MQSTGRNAILDKTLSFSLEIIKFAEQLEEKRKYVIARQILKSGTSIGANVREAQSAESRADFIHKLKIAAKEAEETEYWILLCTLSESYPDCEGLKTGIAEIIKLLSKIISSARNNQRR